MFFAIHLIIPDEIQRIMFRESNINDLILKTTLDRTLCSQIRGQTANWIISRQASHDQLFVILPRHLNFCMNFAIFDLRLRFIYVDLMLSIIVLCLNEILTLN